MKKKFINPEVNYIVLTPRNSIMHDVLVISADKDNIDYGVSGFADNETVSGYNMWKGFSE